MYVTEISEPVLTFLKSSHLYASELYTYSIAF
jgi:hypothetical protein